MSREQKEREVLSEFIEMYRDLPCLWDLTAESYKDCVQKKNAWNILAEKLKEIDPSANAASAKKKMDSLRISYIRESKKVKESKHRTGSSTSDVHKPNLWYFDIMTFLDKKNDVKRKGVDSLVSDDEDEQQIDGTKPKKLSKGRNIEIKKEKLIDTANKLLTIGTEINAFGVYVGKKMEEIPPGQQRDLAEKLISEIIFLAKTNNLTLDTKIEIPSRTHHSAQSYFGHSPSSNSSNSYQYIQSSPSPNCPILIQSPNSPSPHTQHPSSVSSHSYVISQPVNSPPPNCPILIQSPNSPSPHTQHPSSVSSHSYVISQPVNSPPPNCPILIQSPNSPSPHTQHPSSVSSHSYVISQPVNSPSPNCPIPIQSPTSPSSHTQHPSPASSHSYQIIPSSLQITHPNVNVSENAVLYAEGPAGEILKEMLVFRKQ